MLLPAPPPVVPAGAPVTTQMQQWRRDGAVIHYTTAIIEMVPVEGGSPEPRIIFEGEVTVEAGPVVVHANRVVVDESRGIASAEGEVRLTDPDAEIEADKMELDYRNQIGSANNARLRAATVTISAETIEFSPGVQIARNASFYLARHSRPPVFFTAKTITVRGGEVVTADGISLNAYGLRLGPYPRVSFRLDNREESIKLPEIDFDQGKFGLAWSGAFLISQRGLFSFNAVARPGETTRSNARIDFDLSSSGHGQFGRRSPLGERADSGYFNQITVRTPEEEESAFTTERFTIGVGTSFNEPTVGRPFDENRVSRPWFIEAYRHQQVGALSTRLSLAIEQIRPRPTASSVERGVVQFTALAPRFDFGGVESQIRADLFGITGGESYGWARFEAGLFARPFDGITMGVAKVFSTTTGTPDFSFDGLYSRDAWHFRADYDRGPYTLRYLAKYDERLGGWYDQEYEFALVADVFEPFIQYRRFPGIFQFGVRLRLNEFRDVLRRRTAEAGS
ncbi:MAG: hypothetical protein KF812_06670 [Fimbriimonadaceae bacterium]|nr:hypothetical protein [Fimbriimonadaceae bacterium]